MKWTNEPNCFSPQARGSRSSRPASLHPCHALFRSRLFERAVRRPRLSGLMHEPARLSPHALVISHDGPKPPPSGSPLYCRYLGACRRRSPTGPAPDLSVPTDAPRRDLSDATPSAFAVGMLRKKKICSAHTPSSSRTTDPRRRMSGERGTSFTTKHRGRLPADPMSPSCPRSLVFRTSRSTPTANAEGWCRSEGEPQESRKTRLIETFPALSSDPPHPPRRSGTATKNKVHTPASLPRLRALRNTRRRSCRPSPRYPRHAAD